MTEIDWQADAINFGLPNSTYANKKLTIFTPDLFSGVRYLHSRMIDQAFLIFNGETVCIQAPLPSPRPKQERDPLSLTKLIGVIDKNTIRNTADIGIKNANTISNMVVGEITNPASFLSNLNSQRTKLRFRDNTGYIGVFQTEEPGGDFMKLVT